MRVAVVLVMLLFFVVFAGIVGVVLKSVVSGVGRTRANRSAALLRRPARVVAKRHGVAGGSSTAGSRYFATFEFPDGSREEFPMMGEAYGMLAEGDAGLLTSQGTWFKGFQRGGSAIQDAP